MKYKLISLGSACDVAMNLNDLNLRQESLPFDWLWNHHDGLNFVSELLSNDFETVLQHKPYLRKKHYRFDLELPVYRHHEKVAHLHSSPDSNLDEHQTLVKRYHRFIAELQSDNTKHFIYYRNLPEDQLANIAHSIEACLDYALAEVERFFDIATSKYPDLKRKSKFTLIIQVAPSDFDEAYTIGSLYEQQQKLNTDLIRLGIMYTRPSDDKKAYKKWNRQFRRILVQSKLPLWAIIRIQLSTIINLWKEAWLRFKIIVVKYVKKPLGLS